MLDSTRTVDQPAPVYTPGRSACKTDGCTCKDARIVSTRKAAFFRDLAQKRGQTVDRVITAEPLSAVLLRPNEPQVIQSDPAACKCTDCEGGCSGKRTIASPSLTRCRECVLGQHSA